MLQVSETVRAFSQGGSGKVKMCEAARVPVEQYEAAQQRVDERQSEFNKHEATVRRCKRKAKPLNRALVGLRKRLKNCREKIEGLQAAASGRPYFSPTRADSGSESESEYGSADESADSEGDYAPGAKRTSSKKSSSCPKRRRRSPSPDEDSDFDLDLSMGSDDGGDDSSEEEEEVAVPVPAKGAGPKTLPELQAYEVELRAAIDEKAAIVKTVKSDMR